MANHTLAEYEVIDQQWTDRFAANKSWEDFVLEDPVEDIYRFYAYMTQKGTNPSCPKILDAGCGWARYVWRFSNSDYTGIDHSEEMLKVARADTRYHRPDRKFVSGTISAMPFPDQVFDGIWSCCALAGFPTKHLPQVLEEHRRVLKPRGIMTIIMPLSNWDDEGMCKGRGEELDLYQSSYTMGTFVSYVEQTGFEFLESLERFRDGAFTVFLRNPG